MVPATFLISGNGLVKAPQLPVRPGDVIAVQHASVLDPLPDLSGVQDPGRLLRRSSRHLGRAEFRSRTPFGGIEGAPDRALGLVPFA